MIQLVEGVEQFKLSIRVGLPIFWSFEYTWWRLFQKRIVCVLN